MKKRLAAIIAGGVIAAGLSLAGATPASATPGACVAQGNAHLTTGLQYIILNPPKAGVGFNISASVSVCVGAAAPFVHVNGAINANGTLSGGCGQSTGGGNITSPLGSSAFSYTSAATILVITGPGVAGVANAIPNATTGDSCLNAPGADDFLVTTVAVATQ